MATIFTNALGTDRTDGQGSFRDVLPITGGALGQVRVTLKANSSVQLDFNNVSIGISSGTTMITTATPVELLFSGSSGFSIAAGASITSDWVNLSGFTSSDKLVVVMDYTSNSAFGGTSTDQSGTSGATLYFLFGVEASYNKADPTADGSWGNVPWVVAVSLIETQAAGGAAVIVGQSFFDIARPKQPSVDFIRGPFAGTSPALATTFATSPFFDPIKLKRPTVETPPVTFKPATVVTNIVEQPFFDTVNLKRPVVETPIIVPGTSPPLTKPYVTSAFFDVVKPKQPIIDRPPDVPPLVVVVNLSATNWFEAIKLLKIPERFGELYPQQYWTPQAYTPWFDQLKLLKVPDRLQEAFGVPFPPHQSLTAWFDAVQKLKVPGDMPFTATGAVQANTVQYAITDWFERTKLKQPIVETPLVVYFPAQQIVVTTNPHNLQFHVTVGKLKSF